MNKHAKLSLCVQVNEVDGPIDFVVEPCCVAGIIDNIWTYEWETVPQKKFQIAVDLRSRSGNKSHLIIQEIKCDSVVLNNLDTFGRYVTHKDSVLRKTHGYMDFPGRYSFNIHQNALVHNYMLYFWGKCKQSD